MERAALYVHVPFCRAKCDYCDFFSVPCGGGAVPEAYVDALLNEARSAARAYGVTSWRTVYVGGGTPSLLGPFQLERLMGALVGPDAREVTVEMNPETVTAPLLAAAAASGVTRLSLGVQSLDGAALRAVRRRCTARLALEALDMVRGRWHGDVNVDVIAGLPGAGEGAVRSTLRTLLAYQPEHVSLYALSVEDGTPLAARLDAGEPWDADAADAEWLSGRDQLEAAGLLQYEVSNFALPGHESLHNMAYWTQEDYVGVGAGATGTRYDFGGMAGSRGVRWTNTRDIAAYTAYWRTPAARWHDGAVPRSIEPLDMATEEFEFLMMGLRTLRGVDAGEYRRRYAALSPWHGDLAARLGVSGGPWQGFAAEGRAMRSGPGGRRYALTRTGLPFLNVLLRQL